jgi:ribose-phosphate pyrophosphokinase
MRGTVTAGRLARMSNSSCSWPVGANPAPLLVVALPEAEPLAQRLAHALGAELAPVELRHFDDGEFKVRPTLDPAGLACVVVGLLHGDARHSPQDRLCWLLFLIAALKDHGASRVDLRVPYLPYARKDRRTQPFDPVSLRYLAQLLEVVGTDSVATIEVHQPAAFDNAFRIPARSLSGHHLLAEQVVQGLLPADKRALVVASPDPGGIKRAQFWQAMLEGEIDPLGHSAQVGFASVDKRRSLDRLSGEPLACGEVQGATVLMIDDLLVSGSTLARASEAFSRAGARRIIAAVIHDLSTPDAFERLAAAGIERLITGDTIPARESGPTEPASIIVDRTPCAHALALADTALSARPRAQSSRQAPPRSSA